MVIRFYVHVLEWFTIVSFPLEQRLAQSVYSSECGEWIGRRLFEEEKCNVCKAGGEKFLLQTDSVLGVVN